MAAASATDADALMARLAQAARTIAWTSDDAWARIDRRWPGRLGVARRERPGRRPGAARRRGPLSADADVAGDPTLALRAAAAAARTAPGSTADARAAGGRGRRMPPTRGRRDPRRVGRAAAGRAAGAIPVIEALDQLGVWERYCPSGPRCEQAAAQRLPPLHRRPAPVGGRGGQRGALAGRVARPDLLVLGGLLHDIGKGEPGDHTEVGMRLVGEIAPPHGPRRPRRRRARGAGAATTCCCPTWPPAATSTTPPRSRPWREAVGDRDASSCSARSPRPTRWRPARRRGASGRPGWCGRWWPGSTT